MPNVKIVDNTIPAKSFASRKLYTHAHVEDYIEIIAGYRTIDGKSNHSIFVVGEPIVSLARYDMKVVPSLAEQTIGGKGYTDKQAQLAVQLIIKYERQLGKLGLDITPVHTPQYRIPLRELDRTSRAWIENDQINLRFPYDVKLIETVRDASKQSKGRFYFNRDRKLHEADLTEWNLNWIHSFAQQNDFEIDQSLSDMMKLLISAEQMPYAIELQYTDTDLTIAHAPDSLQEFVQDQLGGFAVENIIRLSDHAPVLGYSVSKAIEYDVIKNLGTRFWSLCANRQLKVNAATSPGLIQDIIDYAELTARFPIFVYEPDLSGRLYAEFNKFFPNNIVNLDNKLMDNVIDDSTKVIYTSKIPKRHFPRIPLMVSSAGMLYGGDRQMWIQSAEKVVYFSKDVYNKTTKGQDVCKLD
jgi:hypothetical protein